jgi:D-alanyl-D-alanine carboxypeptidase
MSTGTRGEQKMTTEPTAMKKMQQLLAILCSTLILSACGGNTLTPAELGIAPNVPSNILEIMGKPLYSNATWGLLVLDTQTGEPIYSLNPNELLLIGSVRKLFSVGTALEQLGVGHQFVTTAHNVGNVDNMGVLNGDLVLKASGDVTMGMRRQADGTMAISAIDHNEAAAVGTAVLTNTDARLGYRELATQVAASGVTEVTGEVIVDDRLFQHFDFRGQYMATPAMVNENFVDVALEPTAVGQPANLLEIRPQSAAFTVNSTVTTVAGDQTAAAQVDPFLPDCIGTPGCSGTVSGELPIDGVPPVIESYPIVRNFRIVEPSTFARTVFIEELQNAGVTVNAAVVAPNPAAQLPVANTLTAGNQLAQYTSLPFSEYARLILKVSFNLGADTTLIQFGLANGVNSLAESLAVERATLINSFGLMDGTFAFVDGAGGGESSATPNTVVKMLRQMASRPSSQAFRNGLPRLAVDGTLGILTGFQQDPTLTGATGNVLAKTGTFASLSDNNLIALEARAMAGYIQTRSGRDVTYVLIVNDAGEFEEFLDTVEVNEDLGVISAILWRDL